MKLMQVNLSEITKRVHELDDAGIDSISDIGVIRLKNGTEITPLDDVLAKTGNQFIKNIADVIWKDELKQNYAIKQMRGK